MDKFRKDKKVNDLGLTNHQVIVLNIVQSISQEQIDLIDLDFKEVVGGSIKDILASHAFICGSLNGGETIKEFTDQICNALQFMSKNLQELDND